MMFITITCATDSFPSASALFVSSQMSSDELRPAYSLFHANMDQIDTVRLLLENTSVHTRQKDQCAKVDSGRCRRIQFLRPL